MQQIGMENCFLLKKKNMIAEPLMVAYATATRYMSRKVKLMILIAENNSFLEKDLKNLFMIFFVICLNICIPLLLRRPLQKLFNKFIEILIEFNQNDCDTQIKSNSLINFIVFQKSTWLPL